MMAELFDKMRKEVGRQSKIVKVKSNEVLQTNRVKAEIKSLEKAREELFAAIGKKVYYMEKTEGFELDMVSVEVDAIEKLTAKLTQKGDEITEIKKAAEQEVDTLRQEVSQDVPVDEDVEDVEILIVKDEDID